MSFFKVTGGVTGAGDGIEFLANTNGEQIVQVSNLDTVSFENADPLGNAVAQNTAFVASYNEEVDKNDYMVFEIVIPDDATNNYFLEVFIASQREGSVELLEAVTAVANTAGITFNNRNRNSSATTTATAAQVVQDSDPVTGGTSILTHYIPRDQESQLELGRLILDNDSTNALRIRNLSKGKSFTSVRFDLYVVPA